MTDSVFGKEGAEGPNRSSHPGTPSQDQFLVGFWLPSRSVAEKLRALRNYGSKEENLLSSKEGAQTRMWERSLYRESIFSLSLEGYVGIFGITETNIMRIEE